LVLQICIRDIPIPSETASVPIGFDAWFARAVARDPDARFQSARELTDSLREVLGGETRELQWVSPEVSVTVGEDAPNSQARTRVDSRTPDSSAGALSESASRVRQTGGSIPDQHAATVAAPDGPPSSRAGVPRSMRVDNAVIAEMLANAQSVPPPKRAGAALVFWVAGTALAIGLAAGLVFMRRTDPHLRPLPKAVPPPAHEVVAPRVHVKPEHSSVTVHEDLAPSATASAKPATSGHASTASAVAAKPSGSAAEVAPVATPDAGWVKPAWAIPDEEPRRVHDDDARDAGK
jgi:serine/threonine-protein kinase